MRDLGGPAAVRQSRCGIGMCCGGLESGTRALAGLDPPEDWPRRTAALVWRAPGGSPEAAQGGSAPAG